MKNIIYLEKKIDPTYKQYILDQIKKTKHNVEIFEAKDLFQDLTTIAKKIQTHEVDGAVIIDDDGILPFMVMAKFQEIVVAEVSDEHSSKMTRKHNNSSVLSLGYNLVSKENAWKVIERYLENTFDAGRHMVRINMLKKILEER